MSFVRNNAAGSASSNPSHFSEIDGQIYFIADETVGARQLWRTDGTNAGTDFGNNVIGFGMLNTPNDINHLLMNNGSILGNSAAERITLPGKDRASLFSKVEVFL